MESWRQYYQELLCPNNTPIKEQSTHEPVPEREKEENNDPTLDELVKLCKAPGHDTITSEIIRFLSGTEKTLLLKMYNRAWHEKISPSDWAIGIILPILVHKKMRHQQIVEAQPRPFIEPTLNQLRRRFKKGYSSKTKYSPLNK